MEKGLIIGRCQITCENESSRNEWNAFDSKEGFESWKLEKEHEAWVWNHPTVGINSYKSYKIQMYDKNKFLALTFDELKGLSVKNFFEILNLTNA